jgi:hypothetical protein
MFVHFSTLDPITKAIQDFVSAISQHSLKFLTAMAAIGVLTMAILQAMKDTFPLRRFFQRNWLRNWFKNKAQDAARKGPGFAVSESVAQADLIKLATDNDANAFFDLSIEQLCGQFNSAIQIALDYPSLHRDLLISAASLASAEDLNTVFSPPDAAKIPINPNDPSLDLIQLQQRQAFVDARNRVTHQVQRAIDAIQIAAGFRWKFYLQCASFLLSAAIAGLGIALFFKEEIGAKFITAIVTGVLGGFLAPVARDLVAALQQLRN